MADAIIADPANGVLAVPAQQLNYILVSGGSNTMTCGEILGTVDGDTTAGAITGEATGGGFEVTYIVAETYNDPSTSATGFSLDYTQMPCA